jgi:hypothetical protein
VAAKHNARTNGMGAIPRFAPALEENDLAEAA